MTWIIKLLAVTPLILHEGLHFLLAFSGGLLAWQLTWTIWRRVSSSGSPLHSQPGHAASVARSISRLFWSLLFFLAIASHILIDYW